MRRARGAVPLTVALILTALAMLLLGFSSTLNPVDALLGRGAVVVLPDLSGDTEARATARVQDLNLEPEIARAFSLTAPPGTVIGQSPLPDERVREGTTVELIVSRGARRVEMPDAVGRPFDEIEPVFTDAGIPLEVEYTPTERVPEGEVMAQDPGPGVVVTGEQTITFEVSAGPAPRPVPEVAGRSLDAASFELGVAGLVPGEVVEFDTGDVPVGAVIGTDPPAGEVVAIDTEITVVVSAGPAPVPVPDLTNGGERAALDTLDVLGFEVLIASRLVGPGEPGAGAVFDQYPEAGTLWRPGEPVTIVVGRNVPDRPPPRPTTTTTAPPPTTSPPTTAAPDGDGDDDD